MYENGERGGVNNFDVGKLDIPDYDDTSERWCLNFSTLKVLNCYISYINRSLKNYRFVFFCILTFFKLILIFFVTNHLLCFS